MGTWEINNARKASTPAMVATISAGARFASVSEMGCSALATTTSSSTRFWIWMAKSMPRPIRIGSPEMVTSDRSTLIRPRIENAQTTPTSTLKRGSRRQRTRNISNRITAMIASAAAPSLSMPPCR